MRTKKLLFLFKQAILPAVFALFIPASAQQKTSPDWLIKAPFEHNVFIENTGQFIQSEKDSIKQQILFYTHKGKLKLFFTSTGLSFEYDSACHKEGEDVNEENKDKEEVEGNVKIVPVFMHIQWDGANPDAKVEVQNPVSDYFTYRNPGDLKGHSSVIAHAWQKLIYHNMYKGIDIEFYYPKDKQGLEYDIIVHPGADLSKVKMHYSRNALLSVIQNEVKILSPCANFTNSAPISRDEDGNSVSSNFSLNNNVVSFETGNYDKSKTLVIDPILSTTSFTGLNKAYNLEYDLAGNIYVMGGGDKTQYQLQKYNPAGALQWTYTSTFAYKFNNSYYYGGFTTDNRSGSSYIAEGLDFSGSGCLVEKVNSSGALVTTFPGDPKVDEMWAIAFDYCDNQLIFGTGEGTNGSLNAAAYLDTALAGPITGVNVLNAVAGNSHHDMCMIAFDGVGKCYMASTESASNLYRAQGFQNVLLQVPSATLAPTAWQVQDRSGFIETASIFYYPDLPSGVYLYSGNEFNGLAADLNMVITYDGGKIRKWTPATGIIIDSVTVTPNPQMWGGIAIDCQDNIYVGEQTSFSIYNSALGLVSTTAIGAGDTVYDLKLSPANIVYTCGRDFIAKNAVVIPKMITATATNATGCACNGSATVTSVCDNYPFTYSWSNGQTTQTATGLCPGTYTVTVKDAACIPRTDTAIIHVTGGVNTLVITPSTIDPKCFGVNNGSANVIVTGGTNPYTYLWNPSGQTNANATGLSAGTYTITVTDANGCTATATVTITQPTVLTATISGNTGVGCNGGTNGTATVTAVGGTPGYTYLWNPSGNTNSTATGLSAGNYTVTVTDANGCTATATTIITQPTAITINTTTVSANCNLSNGSATATVAGGSGPYTYLWNPGGNTNSTATGLGAATYTITVTDNKGCTQTATASVTSLGGATVTIGASTNENCFGGSNGSATANVVGGTAPYTYSWNPSAQTNATATGLTAGSYTVTVTDANGCQSIATVNITQPPAIVITSTTVSANCNQSNGSATATVTGGTGAYTYSWNPGGNTNATATGLSAGAYTVTVTDNNGCTQTSTATVSNLNGVTVSISASTNVSCFNGTNGSATSTVVGGTAPYTYLWNPSGQTNATATGLSAGTYAITVTDANGCISIANVTITQPALLNATIGVPTNVSCNGGNNGKATATVAGGTGPYTYAWTPIGGSGSTGTGLTAGNYTVNVTDNNGCTASATVSITEPALLTAIITATNNINCNGAKNGSLAVTAAGGTAPFTYAWTPSGGTNPVASNLSAGSYTVTVTDNNGCTATVSGTVTEPLPITVTISPSQTICSGQSATLTASATGGTGAFTYTWSPGGNTGDSITAFPASSTAYTVTVTDANGCVSNAVAVVSVTQITPLVITGPASVCEGNSVTLVATGPAGTYTWQPGNITGPVITVTPTVTTTYTVSVATVCGAKTDTVTIGVYPIPNVNFTSDIREGCSPLCIQFRDQSSGSIVQWNWLFGTGDSSNLRNPVYCYKNPGNYTVYLTVTTKIGCSSTLVFTDMIHVYSHPHAAFSYLPEPVTIMNPTVQFTDQSTDAYGINYWWWTFGDSDTLSNLQNPFHTYSDTGDYCARLTVMNMHGCIDSTMQCLPVEPMPTLYIPSAFTPNGDGLNEFFTAKGVYIKTFEMYIYDRWGMKLYYTNNINKGWDGRVNGGSTICQEDTYVYLINVTDALDNKRNYIGNVTLIK